MSTDKALNTLKEKSPTLSVGIFSADLGRLDSEVESLESTGIGAIHFDVMDGCFVPMMTAGPLMVKAVRTRLLKDVHLLIENPEEKAESYVAAGADMVTVHLEACRDALPLLRRLDGMANGNNPHRGIVRGVAVNPGTSLGLLEPLLPELEMVVLLTLDPRIQGQGFQDSTFERAVELKRMITASGREILFCIDGGVKRDNINVIAGLGADLVVSGSAVFAGDDVPGSVSYMIDCLKSH
ncbi:ribulose-phosphate 3-epimerase [candidate division KSB1 bacterium]